MKIFTDASSNDSKKITAISCVCIGDDNQVVEQRGLSFFSKDVHFAELFAIRYAVQTAMDMGASEVKILSDSNSALQKMGSYFNCLRKEPDKRGPSIKKFFSKLGTKHGPFLKKALDEMVAIFEKNPSVKFEFVHVRGHQKVKQMCDLKTEEEYNAYWNDYADKLADDIRQLGENSNANVYVALKGEDKNLIAKQRFEKEWKDLSGFVNKNENNTSVSSESIVDCAHPLLNVNVKFYIEPKLIEKKEKKENRAMRTIAYHPRTNPCKNTGHSRSSW